MADIPSWLRGFQRVRASHTTPECHEILGEIRETTEEMRVAQGTSRRPFYQNLGRFAAPSLSNQSQPHLNEVEQIWHNPDPDQMAETLKVAMMTQSSFDPLHIPYNSCILHVLEAYHQMRKDLAEKDHEIQFLKESHKNNVQRLRQQESQWKEKEDNYKNEMKRLEVMLATGARGLELVTLARSMSTLNGPTEATAAESSQADGEKELEYVASIKECMMCDFAERKDFIICAKYTLQERALDAGRKFVSRGSHRSGGYPTLGQTAPKAEYESFENGESSNTTHFERAYSVVRSDTSSAPCLGLNQEVELCTGLPSSLSREGDRKDGYLEQVQGATFGGQSHPDTLAHFEYESIVKPIDINEGKNKPFCRKTLTSDLATFHRGFSFVPGDDSGNLTFVNMKAQNSVQALNDDGKNGKRPCSLQTPNGGFNNEIPARKARQARPATGAEGNQDRVGDKVADCYKTNPEHSSSQSSISMAGRDQYVESRNGPEHVHNTMGLPKASRLAVSNEAKIAAIHAITVSEKVALSLPKRDVK